MNFAAKRSGCFVLYPEQSPGANPQKCWNWFKPTDQQRGRGEPALIAAMTRHVMRSHAIDAGRVYVAGLSAVPRLQSWGRPIQTFMPRSSSLGSRLRRCARFAFRIRCDAWCGDRHRTQISEACGNADDRLPRGSGQNSSSPKRSRGDCARQRRGALEKRLCQRRRAGAQVYVLCAA
jgi:hypothetical protein